MDVATVRALGTPAGRDALAAAERAYAGGADPLAAAAELRRAGTDRALAAAALTQARLRRHAVVKLGPDAGRWLLSEDGLQQATRASVARHRAERVRAVLGEGAHVLDLCCGIGGDLVELARAGLHVTGVDRDPVAVALATHNAALLGLAGRVDVRCADVTVVDRSTADAVVVDPARRSARGRVLDPAASSPPWAFVRDVLRGTTCAKLAPGLAHDLVPAGVEAEWVSDAGEVKEAALWSGRLAGGVRRRATLLPCGATLTDADAPAPVVGPVERWLYEPDGAVIRAGLVTGAAAAVEGHLVDPRIAYVTARTLVRTPLARAYEVLDVLPYEEKRLRAYLRERGVGALSVKKRGVGVEPEALRRAMRLAGPAEATVVVTRLAGRASVLVVRPG